MTGKTEETRAKLLNFVQQLRRRQQDVIFFRWKFPRVPRRRGKLQERFQNHRGSGLHLVRKSALLVKAWGTAGGAWLSRANATHSPWPSGREELPSVLWRLPTASPVTKELRWETGVSKNWTSSCITFKRNFPWWSLSFYTASSRLSVA